MSEPLSHHEFLFKKWKGLDEHLLTRLDNSKLRHKWATSLHWDLPSDMTKQGRKDFLHFPTLPALHSPEVIDTSFHNR